MESAGNSETSGWRRNHEYFSTSRNRYDMLTGVQTNSHRHNQLHRATTMDNLTIYEQEQPEGDDGEPDMTHTMNAITNVPTVIQRNTQKNEQSQNAVPRLKRQKKRYNEFEQLLLNHIRAFQNKITEEEQLQSSTSFPREDAIEFWQTIWLTPNATLREILQIFREEHARDNFKEVSRCRGDRLNYDTQHESFYDFLKNLKKTAKQVFDYRNSKYVKAFLLVKLPVAIQNDLSVAGKQDATVDGIKDFIHRR